LRVNIGNHSYSLNSSTHIMCILSLFNNADVLTYNDIYSCTNIPDRYLKPALYSLACAKYHRGCKYTLLTRHRTTERNDEEHVDEEEKKEAENDKGKGDQEIVKHDTFSLCHNFRSKQRRFYVRTRHFKKDKDIDSQSQKQTETEIRKTRELQVDACVVRIMKARNVLKHNELLREVVEQLRHQFLPQPSLIKRRIESLILREFLRRVDEDMSIYQYCA